MNWPCFVFFNYLFLGCKKRGAEQNVYSNAGGHFISPAVNTVAANRSVILIPFTPSSYDPLACDENIWKNYHLRLRRYNLVFIYSINDAWPTIITHRPH